MFPDQGRPGPKGEAGDGGLPGQKVGAARGHSFTAEVWKLLVPLPETR